MFQKIPADHVSWSYEFERAVADLVVMVSPFAPNFASELWAGLQSISSRLKPDYNWVISPGFFETIVTCEVGMILECLLYVALCHYGIVQLEFRSGGGVVDNTLDYQSRGREIDPPLLRSFG